jgi:hypothetical protein
MLTIDGNTEFVWCLVRERADPAERPLLAWIQKHHLQATDWNVEAAEKLSTVSLSLEPRGTQTHCCQTGSSHSAKSRAYSPRPWPQLCLCRKL